MKSKSIALLIVTGLRSLRSSAVARGPPNARVASSTKRRRYGDALEDAADAVEDARTKPPEGEASGRLGPPPRRGPDHGESDPDREDRRPRGAGAGRPGPGPPRPRPGARIRVAAAGVNFIDVYFRTGSYPRPLPFVAGLEGSGRVEAVGPDGALGLAPGDRVAWALAPGSYAEFVIAPASALVRVPDAVSDEAAAAAMLQGMTAHYLVHAYPASRGRRLGARACSGRWHRPAAGADAARRGDARAGDLRQRGEGGAGARRGRRRRRALRHRRFRRLRPRGDAWTRGRCRLRRRRPRHLRREPGLAAAARPARALRPGQRSGAGLRLSSA